MIPDLHIELPKAVILDGQGIERIVRLEDCRTIQDYLSYIEISQEAIFQHNKGKL